jgi:hypothetical protein
MLGDYFPEDGSRVGFRNIYIFYQIRQLTQSQKSRLCQRLLYRFHVKRSDSFGNEKCGRLTKVRTVVQRIPPLISRPGNGRCFIFEF